MFMLKERMTMKKCLTLLLSVLTALGLFSGCGNPSAPSINPDQVVISISSEPESLDPCKGWGHGTTPLVQSTLLEFNRDMSFSGDLATDYHLSEDGLTWTFHLRQDAVFTDGAPLTANDVAFTYMTAKGSQSSLDLTFLQKAEAPDSHTVVFTLREPASSFLNTVAMVGIVPEHAYSEDYGSSPIGSGPYRFVQWNRQEQLILEANQDYYGAKPSIQKIVLIFQDEDAAFASVKAGQVDVALTAATLADTEIPGYHLEALDTVDCRGITLPLSPNEGKVTENNSPIGNNVTCNLEIRQAMAYALNRETLAQHALNGFGTPCYSVNDGFPWSNPECAIGTDLEFAKSILSEKGWADTDGDGILEKDGLKAAFSCIYPSGDSVRQALSMAAAQQLQEIGIQMTVEGTSWDEITKRMFSDAVCLGWGSVNPYESYCLYHSSNALRNDYYNPEGYSDPVTDRYLEQAMHALTPEEANEFWKKAQWDGTSGTSMEGVCPCIWLVNIDHLYYVRDGLNIGNQLIHPHGSSMPLIQDLKSWHWEGTEELSK